MGPTRCCTANGWNRWPEVAVCGGWPFGHKWPEFQPAERRFGHKWPDFQPGERPFGHKWPQRGGRCDRSTRRYTVRGDGGGGPCEAGRTCHAVAWNGWQVKGKLIS